MMRPAFSCDKDLLELNGVLHSRGVFVTVSTRPACLTHVPGLAPETMRAQNAAFKC